MSTTPLDFIINLFTVSAKEFGFHHMNEDVKMPFNNDQIIITSDNGDLVLTPHHSVNVTTSPYTIPKGEAKLSVQVGSKVYLVTLAPSVDSYSYDKQISK